jgi:hypothetical protein
MVDGCAAIGDRIARVRVLLLRLIMRIGSAILSLAFAGTFLLAAAAAPARTAPRAQTAQASHSGTDLSAQSRRYRRPPARIRVYPSYNPDDVYPRYFPGRNAVRDCTATYVQEFRPSGTVITPRVNCFWRPG